MRGGIMINTDHSTYCKNRHYTATKYKILHQTFLLLAVLFLLCKSLHAEQRNGFAARIGIGADYMQHKANDTIISGVAMSINGNLGWIWNDYGKIDFFLSYGIGPHDIHGEYPINATNLSSFNFSGGLFQITRLGGKGGYNIASAFQQWEHAFYINIGIEVAVLSHVALYTPYFSTLSAADTFVELEGRKTFGEKWSMEYLGRLSISNVTTIFGGPDITQTQRELTSTNIFGYGFKAGIGANYKWREKTYFFTNLSITYQFIGKTDSKTLTTTANPQVNGIQANQTAIVQYPDNHTIYVGLQFGFGF